MVDALHRPPTPVAAARPRPVLQNGPVAMSDARLTLALAQAEASPDGLLVVSPEGRMVFWNDRFADIWRFPAEVLHGADDNAALDAASTRVVDAGAFLRGVQAAYADPTSPVQDEIELLDGRILDRHGLPLRSPAGEYLGWAWYFRDVTFHRRTERDLRELAETLQRSLLPPRPPAIPGMEVATRYRPADDDIGIGGDFFDVFRLATNAWGLAIGDVCGKGAKAATLTTLARHTIRAAAVHAPLPSDVLQELNTVIAGEPDHDGRFCSVAFAKLELDACGAWVTLSCGGHPRPIVIRRAGWLDVRGQAGQLIGLFHEADLEDDRVGLGPGDALVFCTDGITEARNADGEMFGEEALPDALLAVAGRSADDIAGALLDAALGFGRDRRRDDIALVVVRVPEDATVDPAARLAAAVGTADAPLTDHEVGNEYEGLRRQRPAPPREARARLASDVRSVGAARRFVAGALHSWRMSELAEGDVVLLTSEVAGNAVRHGGGGDFTVVVRYDGRAVRVEVGDGSRVLPEIRTPDPTDPNGRGLFLVEQVAESWGVVPTVDGKRVWFSVPAPLP
jgi:anti-sigma regulatory factor (Ser/Thr protein kinase)